LPEFEFARHVVGPEEFPSALCKIIAGELLMSLRVRVFNRDGVNRTRWRTVAICTILGG